MRYDFVILKFLMVLKIWYLRNWFQEYLWNSVNLRHDSGKTDLYGFFKISNLYILIHQNKHIMLLLFWNEVSLNEVSLNEIFMMICNWLKIMFWQTHKKKDFKDLFHQKGTKSLDWSDFCPMFLTLATSREREPSQTRLLAS